MRLTPAEFALYEARRAARAVTPEQAAKRAQEATLKQESEFHEQIATWLAMKGVQAVIHSRTDKRSTQERGVADFCFAVNGRAVAMEAKVQGRQPTPEQVAWLARAAADGWITAVVRTLADVVEVYRKAEQG